MMSPTAPTGFPTPSSPSVVGAVNSAKSSSSVLEISTVDTDATSEDGNLTSIQAYAPASPWTYGKLPRDKSTLAMLCSSLSPTPSLYSNATSNGSITPYIATDPPNINVTSVLPSSTMTSSNNTPIGTGSHIITTTFVATGHSGLLSSATGSAVTSTESSFFFSSATKVSVTASSTSSVGKGLMGFTGAVVSDVGHESSSSAGRVVEQLGSTKIYAASLAMIACFGLSLLP